MKNSYIIVSLFCIAVCLQPKAFAQTEKGFSKENYKRNVIKWNMTPFVIWGAENINLSYERVVKPNRSFSVNAGNFNLPSLGIYENLNIESANSKAGFTVSGDYRFYFKQRNINQAPDGLYWGPFASYHHYQFENNITVINNPDIQGALLLEGKYNIISAGVELGYQFIIKERLSIDLVFMGPSLSMYSGKLKLDGDLTSEEYNDYLEAVRDILFSKIPLLGELVQEGTVDDKGSSASLGFGLRYLIQIGYRF